MSQKSDGKAGATQPCVLFCEQLQELGGEPCRYCERLPSAHKPMPAILNPAPLSTAAQNVEAACKLLPTDDAHGRGKRLEEIVAWSLIESFTGKVPFRKLIRSTPLEDPDELEKELKTIMRDKIQPLQATRMENANSEEFVRFIESRDSKVIQRPNNKGPGPDLCFFLGPRVLVLLGLKTSSSSNVTSTNAKLNRRSTNLEYWWDVHDKISNNMAALHRRAMEALFPSKKKKKVVKRKHPDVELVIRVHIVLPDSSKETTFTPGKLYLEKIKLPSIAASISKSKCGKNPIYHDVVSLEIDLDKKHLLTSGLLPANLHGYIERAFTAESQQEPLSARRKGGKKADLPAASSKAKKNEDKVKWVSPSSEDEAPKAKKRVNARRLSDSRKGKKVAAFKKLMSVATDADTDTEATDRSENEAPKKVRSAPTPNCSSSEYDSSEGEP